MLLPYPRSFDGLEHLLLPNQALINSSPLGQREGTLALTLLLSQLCTHFEYEENIRRDPGLYLVYDWFASLLGDDPQDSDGIEMARAALLAAKDAEWPDHDDIDTYLRDEYGALNENEVSQ